MKRRKGFEGFRISKPSSGERPSGSEEASHYPLSAWSRQSASTAQTSEHGAAGASTAAGWTGETWTLD